MRLGVGFPVLPEESWLARPPSVGSWIALATLVAMIAAYTLVRRGRNSSPQITPDLVRTEEHARRVWLTLALLLPGLAVLSDADLRAVAWWFVAGPAFSTVLLVNVGLLVLAPAPSAVRCPTPTGRHGGGVRLSARGNPVHSSRLRSHQQRYGLACDNEPDVRHVRRLRPGGDRRRARSPLG